MDRIWLKAYSAGVPADIDPGRYANLIELIETAPSRVVEAARADRYVADGG